MGRRIQLVITFVRMLVWAKVNVAHTDWLFGLKPDWYSMPHRYKIIGKTTFPDHAQEDTG